VTETIWKIYHPEKPRNFEVGYKKETEMTRTNEALTL
jgi:hypothetical protein